MNLLANRAAYTYTIEDGIVCVIDLDNGKSVTNDADNLIADLVANGIDLAVHPVIYKDTQGVWDQLVVQNNRFANFKSINERSKEAAIAKIKASK